MLNQAHDFILGLSRSSAYRFEEELPGSPAQAGENRYDSAFLSPAALPSELFEPLKRLSPVSLMHS
jgi:hypothetical protein